MFPLFLLHFIKCLIQVNSSFWTSKQRLCSLVKFWGHSGSHKMLFSFKIILLPFTTYQCSTVSTSLLNMCFLTLNTFMNERPTINFPLFSMLADSNKVILIHIQTLFFHKQIHFLLILSRFDSKQTIDMFGMVFALGFCVGFALLLVEYF